MTERITLTWPARAKMWAHFLAIVVFCVAPLFGNATGVWVGFLGFIAGLLAMAVAQIHAGLWDLEAYMLTGRE